MRILLEISGGVRKAQELCGEVGLQVEDLTFQVKNPLRENQVTISPVSIPDLRRIQNGSPRHGGRVVESTP